MTLSELIEHLSTLAEGLDFDEVEVKLAHQPRLPFELSIGEPVLHDPLEEWEEENALTSSDDPYYEDWLADRAIAEGKPKTIFIPEGRRRDYLRGSVAKQLGWRR
jgi:hypothetical protein